MEQRSLLKEMRCACGNSIKKKMLGNACSMRTPGDILFEQCWGTSLSSFSVEEAP
jgi:hypothetical protein